MKNNHLQNLKDYISLDLIYDEYKKNKDMKLTDFEKFCVSHIEDIQYLINEYERLKEKDK